MTRQLKSRLRQLRSEFSRYGIHPVAVLVRCVADRAESLAYLSATCRDVSRAMAALSETDRRAS